MVFFITYKNKYPQVLENHRIGLEVGGSRRIVGGSSSPLILSTTINAYPEL